jgi:hypothetical protein
MRFLTDYTDAEGALHKALLDALGLLCHGNPMFDSRDRARMEELICRTRGHWELAKELAGEPPS